MSAPKCAHAVIPNPTASTFIVSLISGILVISFLYDSILRFKSLIADESASNHSLILSSKPEP